MRVNAKIASKISGARALNRGPECERAGSGCSESSSVSAGSSAFTRQLVLPNLGVPNPALEPGTASRSLGGTVAQLRLDVKGCPGCSKGLRGSPS